MSEDDDRPEWVRRLEEKHGLPMHQIPGTVYACCYDPPIVVRSVSLDYAGDPPKHDDRGYLSAGPITHYVGWTQQRDPWRRINNHHSPSTQVTVTLGQSITMEREEEVKRSAKCPTCGQANLHGGRGPRPLPVRLRGRGRRCGYLDGERDGHDRALREYLALLPDDAFEPRLPWVIAQELRDRLDRDLGPAVAHHPAPPREGAHPCPTSGNSPRRRLRRTWRRLA